ncbi:MAG: tRNA (adenosine(37)-N6)-dimethylallyltransferase MiaA [Paraprevotella sp.]|nr:tRNA (adenosine(37)-N6)-dimethylallyltransferase MiaA [Paraprevotella sp.]MCI6201875.1 tRNA (adenosine(37)-N6)-dimethylallyltransferase MiaA [Paraprevotella sp.]
MKKLIVILGPTGVGKTSLCLHIAKEYNVPVINADSRQMFKELPIGTAAPTIKEQEQAKHYFVGNLTVDKYYNASMFENDVLSLLDILFKQQDIALMSGGSMMYIDAVCNGIDDIPTVDTQIRQRLKERYEQEGLESIIQELRQLDPEYYNIVDKKNHKRVIHALEICLSTGKAYSSFRHNVRKTRPFQIIKIGLTRNREELYSRIDQRVDEMISNGLLKEAANMYPQRNLNALNTVGYKELFDYIDGKTDLQEAIFKIKSNTHKYCRKQLTWFKRDPEIKWFTPENVEEIINYINSFA